MSSSSTITEVSHAFGTAIDQSVVIITALGRVSDCMKALALRSDLPVPYAASDESRIRPAR